MILTYVSLRVPKMVWRVVLLGLALACLVWGGRVQADQAQYLYDDLGRLVQVIDGQGEVATYTYDAVGNLLAISRNTGGVGAPTITALTPTSGSAGTSVTVSLTGTNLTGATVATDNPGVLVRNVQTTATSIAATLQLSFSARTGARALEHVDPAELLRAR